MIILAVIILFFCGIFPTEKLLVHCNSWIDLANTAILPTQKQCGKVGISNRIMGGGETYIDEFPWTALLLYKNESSGELGSLCMGSLINQYYVITAAQCVSEDKIKADITLQGVRLGEWNIVTKTDCENSQSGREFCAPPPEERGIANIIIHPKFNPRKMTNDLALIRMTKKAEYTEFVSPICLPLQKGQQYLGYANSTAEISGWGENKAAARSRTKTKARVKILNLIDCVDTITRSGGYGYTYSSFLQTCAMGDGIAACKLDTGAPLMVQDTKNKITSYYLIGVFSSVEGTCELRNSPNIYTRIYPQIDWIQKVVNS
ncbi:serine protease easter-like [Bactrocera neohumeralis]|uniref:serine protease easter-like n=1 Tax=Bactrocera neohumeralis TaxID=98809 RepID=UPI0021663BE7|nr:serine protease easter-like [Bactrocera neohumeralis]